jgi:SAM-dependent methyltransferase
LRAAFARRLPSPRGRPSHWIHGESAWPDSDKVQLDRCQRGHGCCAQVNAKELGAEAHICFQVGDIHDLHFEDESLDLVVAVGVLPWIDDVETALREMARIT